MDTEFKKNWVLERIQKCDNEKLISFVFWFIMGTLKK